MYGRVILYTDSPSIVYDVYLDFGAVFNIHLTKTRLLESK